jgi:glycine cleavage system H lipoate-binding protein/ABC-type phosphate transport system substrate-binding protein
MKTTIFLSAATMLVFLTGNLLSQDVASKNASLQQGSATIMSTPDLYELASKWASEYSNLNNASRIKVINTTYNSSDLGISEKLSFISNKSQAAIGDEKNWKMVIGRDIIVPIMNAENSFIKEIMQRGVSSEQFAQLFNNPDKRNWGTILAGGQNTPVQIYMINDESAKNSVMKFLQASQIPVNGINFGTKDEVVAAIQKDPYAIGFCKIVNIMVPGNQDLIEKVRLLPIDKNGNGTLDYMEDIYSNTNDFLRGVWIGKYPKSLYSNIYVVSNVPPANETETAFLAWVLTDGQKYMNASGFCELAGSESQAQLERINTAVINVTPVNDASQVGTILLILAMLITLGIIVSVVVRSYRRQEDITPDFSLKPESFSEDAVVIPQGIYFDKSHTWVFREKDGNLSVGIDDFLQHIAGPITRVEMKNPGEKVKKGDLLFSIIQSGKQLSLYSPVSGTIKKQNETLISNASYINSSPYNDGWVYMIEPSNWNKEVLLMEMAEKYKRWIDNEFSRVKDFLAAKLKPDSLEYSNVVMQDGGILKEGVLTDFGPEVWEDFQTNFLDNYK